MTNKDETVIEEFGDEWTKFDYGSLDEEKLEENFQQYFNIFPWDMLPKDAVGFDMGCGSGRWAKLVAPKVNTLNCVEPSNAIDVAKNNLSSHENVKFYKETTEDCTISPGSQDFGYSLGVLHHIPNTQEALNDCTKLLKPRAPILLYLYYNFENKPLWFKFIWKVSDYIRRVVSMSPKPIKHFLSAVIALVVYFPLSRAAHITEKFGINVENIPLSDYRAKPFYQCKNDALDRFGTRLEQRFSKSQITEMLTKAGCTDIEFSPNTPYWCCVAFKND
ncbi:MAG: SAM-dependent methyltransferase [Flammeovirgaceae bacterium]|nr:SAM-dependent methyltransferase [Flammeovirgaceae bacterium]|tara:strand:- start:215 stop:1042 length:828 start_codon:yes stop_codon:yes gene_type:complete